jgi:hypothetical protein
MLLEINEKHKNFLRDILPFTKNGILIDTSIMKIFLDGFTKLRFSKIKDEEYEDLIAIFEYLHVANKWHKFWITPHLFTEICQHFCQDENRNKRCDFHKIVEEVMPILKEIQEERNITKDNILELIDKNKPVIEMGDLSIFIAIENILETKKKFCVIEKDKDIRDKYIDYPNVLVIDYHKTILDLKQKG